MTLAENGLLDSEYVVADVETTGIDEEACVVQFALIRFVRGRARERYSALIDPIIPIPSTASAIHLIRDRDVSGRPVLPEVADDIAEFVGDSFVVAHNAPFDHRFLDMIGDNPWICTLRLARRIWPDAPRHTNGVLRFHLDLDDEYDLGRGPMHDAETDALVTGYLFARELRLLADRLDTLHDVWDICWRPLPVTHFHYGRKHYGRPIAAIPPDYLKWVAQQQTLPENQRKILIDDDTLHAIQDELACRLFAP